MNRDEALAIANLDTALERIAGEARLADAEKQEIRGALRSLFRDARPYFDAGAGANPLYHHTQVLDNMVRIGLGETLEYGELKNATILALLHDIGNAVSQRQKVKYSQVELKVAELEKATTGEPARDQAVENRRWDEVRDLAAKAMAFRLEHMDHGPPLIRKITKRFVDQGVLKEDDLHFICRAVAVHDYPSIEKSLERLRDKGIDVRYPAGSFLLPLDDSPVARLVTLLREADRLFMVSQQGVEKDLIDDVQPLTPQKRQAKLAENANSHRGEYELYRRAHRDDGRFLGQTLYRTKTGYAIFREMAARKYVG